VFFICCKNNNKNEQFYLINNIRLAVTETAVSVSYQEIHKAQAPFPLP